MFWIHPKGTKTAKLILASIKMVNWGVSSCFCLKQAGIKTNIETEIIIEGV